ncbi:MAG: bifunctional DNA-formamidopyrimidine glycosylase/DNA-(apurinic or apyrimidinic site) lyase [Phycisphaerales bacterium]|nr:bifunctional DNA-formamidopyrimidine glycosylase/DNA-(apurinic or apyrimidinic site) lyase [Phycisphaerales bacterium]
MPELPEVETIVRQLQAALRGRRVASVEVLRADIVRAAARPLAEALPGRTVRRVTRRAKRILFDLGNCTMVVHLGMSGRLTLCAATSPVAPHTHLRIRFRGMSDELRFRDPRRFGGVWLLDEAAIHDTGHAPRLGPVGPEPLELTPLEFQALLAGRRRQIKPLLMDQRAIAGLGNIYVDESLFEAGIHPLSRAGDLTAAQARRLLAAIQRILRRAIRSKGSTLLDYRRADGESGGFQRLFRVFRRTGQPCPRCGTTIKRLIIGGRSSHVCPKCQLRGT